MRKNNNLKLVLSYLFVFVLIFSQVFPNFIIAETTWDSSIWILEQNQKDNVDNKLVDEEESLDNNLDFLKLENETTVETPETETLDIKANETLLSGQLNEVDLWYSEVEHSGLYVESTTWESKLSWETIEQDFGTGFDASKIIPESKMDWNTITYYNLKTDNKYFDSSEESFVVFQQVDETKWPVVSELSMEWSDLSIDIPFLNKESQLKVLSIESNMINWEFFYDLVLPIDPNSKSTNFSVYYREDTNSDFNLVTNKTEIINVKWIKKVLVHKLNHFTEFVVIWDEDFVLTTIYPTGHIEWRREHSVDNASVDWDINTALPHNFGFDNKKLSRPYWLNGRAFLWYFENNKTIWSLEGFDFNLYSKFGSDFYTNIYIKNVCTGVYYVMGFPMTIEIPWTIVYEPDISHNLRQNYNMFTDSGLGKFRLRTAKFCIEWTMTTDFEIYSYSSFDELKSVPTNVNSSNWYIENHNYDGGWNWIWGIVFVWWSSNSTTQEEHNVDWVVIDFIGQDEKYFDFETSFKVYEDVNKNWIYDSWSDIKYNQIQQSIDDARTEDWDRITVKDWVYYEKITINKEIKLKSENLHWAVLDWQWDLWAGITIADKNIQIYGFEVSGFRKWIIAQENSFANIIIKNNYIHETTNYNVAGWPEWYPAQWIHIWYWAESFWGPIWEIKFSWPRFQYPGLQIKWNTIENTWWWIVISSVDVWSGDRIQIDWNNIHNVLASAILLDATKSVSIWQNTLTNNGYNWILINDKMDANWTVCTEPAYNSAYCKSSYDTWYDQTFSPDDIVITENTITNNWKYTIPVGASDPNYGYYYQNWLNLNNWIAIVNAKTNWISICSGNIINWNTSQNIANLTNNSSVIGNSGCPFLPVTNPDFNFTNIKKGQEYKLESGFNLTFKELPDWNFWLIMVKSWEVYSVESDLQNWTFLYELELYNPYGDKAKVMRRENSLDSRKSIPTDKLKIEDSFVRLELDHFTDFIVTNWDNLQSKINSASAGDTIYVEPWIYDSIIVDKPLNIISNWWIANIQCSSPSWNAGIKISSSNVLVQWFEISSCKKWIISEWNFSNITIKNNIIHDLYDFDDTTWIWWYGYQSNWIHIGHGANEFDLVNNWQQGESKFLWPKYEYDNLVIDWNEIYNTRGWIILDSITVNSNTIVLQNNNIHNNWASALTINSSDNIQVDNNIMNQNDYNGITLRSTMDFPNYIPHWNTCTNRYAVPYSENFCYASYYTGIWPNHPTQITITNNTISNNWHYSGSPAYEALLNNGIALWSADWIYIANNNITWNWNSDVNRTTCNVIVSNFCYNTIQSAIDSAPNWSIIEIWTWNFSENIKIFKPITLVGVPGQTSIVSNWDSDWWVEIWEQSNSNVLSNVSIQWINFLDWRLATCSLHHHLKIHSVDGLEFENVKIEWGLCPSVWLDLNAVKNTVLENVEIKNYAYNGIAVTAKYFPADITSQNIVFRNIDLVNNAQTRERAGIQFYTYNSLGSVFDNIVWVSFEWINVIDLNWNDWHWIWFNSVTTAGFGSINWTIEWVGWNNINLDSVEFRWTANNNYIYNSSISNIDAKYTKFMDSFGVELDHDLDRDQIEQAVLHNCNDSSVGHNYLFFTDDNPYLHWSCGWSYSMSNIPNPPSPVQDLWDAYDTDWNLLTAEFGFPGHSIFGSVDYVRVDITGPSVTLSLNNTNYCSNWNLFNYNFSATDTGSSVSDYSFDWVNRIAWWWLSISSTTANNNLTIRVRDIFWNQTSKTVTISTPNCDSWWSPSGWSSWWSPSGGWGNYTNNTNYDDCKTPSNIPWANLEWIDYSISRYDWTCEEDTFIFTWDSPVSKLDKIIDRYKTVQSACQDRRPKYEWLYYPDVIGHKYEEEIEDLHSYCAFHGFNGTNYDVNTKWLILSNFQPDKLITRSEAIKIIVNASLNIQWEFSLQEDGLYHTNSYSNIKWNERYTIYIDKAKELGIIQDFEFTMYNWKLWLDLDKVASSQELIDMVKKVAFVLGIEEADVIWSVSTRAEFVNLVVRYFDIEWDANFLRKNENNLLLLTLLAEKLRKMDLVEQMLFLEKLIKVFELADNYEFVRMKLDKRSLMDVLYEIKPK